MSIPKYYIRCTVYSKWSNDDETTRVLDGLNVLQTDSKPRNLHAPLGSHYFRGILYFR